MNSPTHQVTHIECGCSGVNHVLQLSYHAPYEYKEIGEEAALFLSMNVPYPRPWWKRVWLATKYIFLNSDCAYLGFEHVYTLEGAKKQMEILKLFIDNSKESK
jgi:hypothetical protein